MLEQETQEEEFKSKKTHILFLCTGNSCRSQMAEGWTRYLGSDVAEVNSAGIEAHGLNPNAIKIMRESGVDISSQVSKVVTLDIVHWADLIVTTCGDADEHCPVLPTKTKKIHWPVRDPAKATGTEEEIIQEFQTVRDEIRERVFELLNGFRETVN
jgi:arsenate reductase